MTEFIRLPGGDAVRKSDVLRVSTTRHFGNDVWHALVVTEWSESTSATGGVPCPPRKTEAEAIADRDAIVAQLGCGGPAVPAETLERFIDELDARGEDGFDWLQALRRFMEHWKR